MSDGIPCIWMRGGSSKGGYFLASDLPADPATRDPLLLRIMGSPDPRQIDGMGGASPLTSKVGVVSPSPNEEADVDYLFLQVFVDEARVSDAQPCGNILAGIGPFAIERGLVAAEAAETKVRIRQINTGQIATARFPTVAGRMSYEGAASIDGVPGTSVPIRLMTPAAPGRCAATFPTGEAIEEIEGIACTLVDAGMPAVLMCSDAFGLTGDEAPEEMEANEALCAHVEKIRLAAGRRMGLGDVSEASVPKMCLLSPPSTGGRIATRCFIPRAVHRGLGVLCAVSIAAGALRPGTTAAEVADAVEDDDYVLEHPGGTLSLALERNAEGGIAAAGSVRTARKLMEGRVFP
ncbi:4-oxalomesaconate tautomerase [Roseivivax jejudonensis]|uniref:4-oxalomesaconate tautomerase n=1 Tax=Roseivivax jejudonensis TaxID=1529041 RepID=A0A1X7A592_9RHOB|nr:4-oxalomesaconate tautomerase [Roseivivax jejudonensis]SLN70977.1 4-oxalomesaconate tautomerase [Roseivivax jejudonensis]